MPSPIRQHLALVCSILLGATMLLAAFAKLESFDSFLLFLRGLRYFPTAAVPVVGILVPSVEIALGACCILGSPKRHVLLTGIGLMGGFLVLQLLLAIPALKLSEATCPCFGDLFPQNGSGSVIARTGAVFALSIACFVLHQPSFRPHPHLAP